MWLLCCCGGCDGTCSDIPTLTFTADHTTEKLTVTHNFNDDDQVRLVTSGTLPTGLDLLTPYYVIVVDSSTIQLSTTAGGSAVTFSDNGTGTHEITDTTWIEDSWGTEAELLARGWVRDASVGSGGDPDPFVDSRGNQCELVVEDVTDTANDDARYYKTFDTPTGSGWVVEISSIVYSHPNEIFSDSSTVGITIGSAPGGIPNDDCVQFFARPRGDDHARRTKESGFAAISEAYDDGERLTTKVTEDSGNHDVELIKTVSGTPNTIYSETGATGYTFGSTVELSFNCSDAGGWACWYARLRNGT